MLENFDAWESTVLQSQKIAKSSRTSKDGLIIGITLAT